MKISSLTFLLFFTFCTYSKEKTLFPDHISHGLYIAPSLSTKTFSPANHGGYAAGLQIGWVLDHQFTIGVQAHQLWTNIKADWTPSEEQLYLNFSYAGLRLSYLYRPEELVHIELFALYGGGLTGYRQQEFGDYDNVQDDFQIIEPGLSIEANITHFFRLVFGASYHFVHGIELPDMSDAHFSGLSLCLVLKVGIF